MTILQSGSELFSSINVRRFELTKTIVTNRDVEMTGTEEVHTTLAVGSHAELSKETPIYVVADEDGKVLCVARVVQEPHLALVSDGLSVKLNGALRADDLIRCMYALSKRDRIVRFGISLFRDNSIKLSERFDKIDVSFRHNFEKESGQAWPPFMRDGAVKTNNCKIYAFCKNDKKDDKCCNALTGKCHHNC